MNSRSGISWTPLAIALGLMCLFLSFSAMAQTSAEKPLDEDAVAELKGELTAVLISAIDDQAQITAIREKWDAREDLAGKTRAEILKLLSADVSSVVKDKETRDKIRTSWRAEQKSETQTPVNKPEKPVTPPAKPPHQLPNEVRPDRINLILIGEKFEGSPWEKTVVDGNLQAFSPSTVDIEGYPLENQPAYDCERAHGAGNCVKVVGYYAETSEHGVDYVDRYVKRCAAGMIFYGLGAVERAIRCGRPDSETEGKALLKIAAEEARFIRPRSSWTTIAWDEKVRITELFEVAEVCSAADMAIRPGSRFAVGGRCFRNMREAIPSGNSPAYYCEKVHGAGNCVLIKDTVVVGLGADHEERQWAVKKCPAGFQYYSENLKFNETSSGSGNWEYRLYCARNNK